jgi:hypothetical protein
LDALSTHDSLLIHPRITFIGIKQANPARWLSPEALWQ